MIDDPSLDTHTLDNSLRFRELVSRSYLAQATAMTLFNRGRASPVTESGWKRWLAEPGDERWAAISDDDLRHAESVFAAMALPSADPCSADCTID